MRGRIGDPGATFKSKIVDLPEERCEKTRVRFVTWNIKHAELRGLAAIEAQLRESDADVIALQEVDRHVARSGREDQPHQLASALGMAYGFAPALQLEGGDYGCALLVKPELIGGRPLGCKTLPLPGGDGVGEETRTLLSARAGGHRVFVAHLDLPAEVRERQADAIVAALGSSRGAVLLGDFNEGKRGHAVKRLLRAGLHDAWDDCFAEERATAPSDRPQERIDLILLGEGVGPARAARIVETDASDHPLVVVDL